MLWTGAWIVQDRNCSQVKMKALTDQVHAEVIGKWHVYLVLFITPPTAKPWIIVEIFGIKDKEELQSVFLFFSQKSEVLTSAPDSSLSTYQPT